MSRPAERLTTREAVKCGVAAGSLPAIERQKRIENQASVTHCNNAIGRLRSKDHGKTSR